MGCRFCMVSCPFDVPKFEYFSANPKINKCTMCFERLQQGRKPACVKNCPFDALAFGKRSELLQEARARIAKNPEQYHPAIYGEHEAGGTSWLYLSAVPFDQIGFRTDLGNTAYPEFAKPFLYTVPLVLTLGPAFMLGLSNATKPEPGPKSETREEEASDGKHHLPGRDVA
jgi:NAD-dependent dihydropyrimidine dehydrogenase PreA subunit